MAALLVVSALVQAPAPMPRFDPSPWNLGVSLGALATACGPVIPNEQMDPTSLGDHEPMTTSGDDAASDASPSCDPPCAYGYVCDAGVCVPDHGCLEFGCCYDDPCCGEGPCCYGYDDGCYGCYSVGDCGGGSFCGDDGTCHPIVLPPDCTESMTYVEVLGPLPGEVASVFSLAFAELDGEPGGELVIGHQAGALLIPGPGEPALALPLASDVLVEDIASGDLDGDGDHDLVMSITPAASVPTLVVLRNDGASSFAVVDTGQSAFDPTPGDVDGDGLPDLAVALQLGPGTRALSVLRNGGDLLLGNPTLLDIDSVPLDIDVGDIDGDGLAEVVGVDNLQQNVWYGADPIDGFPDWTAADVSSYPVSMVVGDFDGDGLDDLARLTSVNGWTLVDGFRSTVDGLQNLPEWGLQGETAFAPDAGDLDGDGRTDLVRSFGQMIEVRHGGAQELFGCLSRIEVPLVPYRLDVGDFTGDGLGDVAISDGGTVQVYAVASVAPP